jgi:membrane-associated HD superfamily phosphohydrolase
MTFFYQKAKESAGLNDREVSEGDFRYPGPKPQSKEAAVLMMADSVEAASRTLSNPSAPQIQGMIERLIEDILADNQLDECDVTIGEVRLAKESFFKVLSGIYHRRIDYPGYDFKFLAENSDKTQLRDSGNHQAKAI